jgi:hypothetical protein
MSHFKTKLGQEDNLNCGEEFEHHLLEEMDFASQKSAKGREMALEALGKALKLKSVPEFVLDRQTTFTDLILKSLKKGHAFEKTSASKLATQLCIQLGGSEDFFQDLKSMFMTILNDLSAPLTTRKAVASTIGLCSFLASKTNQDVLDSLENIFYEDQPTSEEFEDLQIAALAAWTLLKTLEGPKKAFESLQSQSSLLEQLLESPNLDLRIAAGEAIAVLHEKALEHDQEMTKDLVEDWIIPQIQELVRDSSKSRSKKDRKEQKSCFRDILKTMETGEEYFEQFTLNKREVLEIKSWSMKIQYDQICQVLNLGMNLHLVENELLREIFDLGEVLPALSRFEDFRAEKNETRRKNLQNFKIRSQKRGNNRDKKSAVIIGDF